MVSYSKSINLIWQLAATETIAKNNHLIEIEHIFIGLLRANDTLDEKYRKQFGIELPVDYIHVLQDELSLVDGLFTGLGIDRVRLRRYIRGLIGKGDFVYDGKVIHRSEGCKGYFNHAETIAKKEKALTIKPIHLLRSIVYNPSNFIWQAFTDFNIDIEILKSASIGEKVNMPAEGKVGILMVFGIDLTQLAKEGKIEPLIGRQEELLKVVRTLTRKTKNNPILIGEAGVGKTAIVKGLALRIAQGNITSYLKDKKIIELNIAGIIAGTKYRGEFEDKLLRILDEAKRDKEVILFIDEIHTIVGAGSAGSALDVANIMKPLLASGEIKCIGATTIAEYRKYIEKDPALERRFLPLIINEPTEEEAISILNGLKERYEKHHGVVIATEAIVAAVRLSIRYIADRQLPDKAIDIIDEACSRVKIDDLNYYGDTQDIPLQDIIITEDVVAKVVSDWSGIPVKKPGQDEQERLARLEDELSKRVVGQDYAIKKVATVIKIARAGLRDPKKPFGVFLFLGPTGVGKTELAKALSDCLFGSEDALIRFDMSEYMEKHSVSKLIGSPPGYVGYEEEGQLTEKLRTKPYSVVLFDEIEKAHPAILDLFLQVFDEGRLTDSKGRAVDGTNAIFIMTSNIEIDQDQKKKRIGFDISDHSEIDEVNSKSLLKELFLPEFLNRIDEIIQFRHLETDDIVQIVLIMLEKLKSRLNAQNITIEFTDEVVNLLSEKGYDDQFGARPIARTIEQLISVSVSEIIISGKIKSGDRISIEAENGQILILNRR